MDANGRRRHETFSAKNWLECIVAHGKNPHIPNEGVVGTVENTDGGGIIEPRCGIPVETIPENDQSNQVFVIAQTAIGHFSSNDMRGFQGGSTRQQQGDEQPTNIIHLS